MTESTLAKVGQRIGQEFQTVVRKNDLGTADEFIDAAGGGDAGDTILGTINTQITTLQTELQAAIDLKETRANKGAADGYVGLNNEGEAITPLGTLAIDTITLPIIDADFMTGVPDGFTYSRAGTATYINADGNIQTAAIDTPRFERDPLTGRKLGMLIEADDRTNLFLHSAQFDASAWTKAQMTAAQTGTDGTSPLGVAWWRLTEDTSTNEHTIRQSVSLAPGKHTISVMVKDGGTMGQFILCALGQSSPFP